MRHFGLSRREAVGGNQLPGARSAHDTQHANLFLSPLAALELREIAKPSPDEFEPGSYVLFFFVLLGPAICVGAAVALYLLFVSEPI